MKMLLTISLTVLLIFSWFICGCVNNIRIPSIDQNIEIRDVEFLGAFLGKSHKKSSIVSQDGGESFYVPGGTIWAYGDTFLGTRDENGSPIFKGGGLSASLSFLPSSEKKYPLQFDYLHNNTTVPL